MKKLFMLIAVIVLAAFCFSCSGDDKPGDKKLVLISDATDGNVEYGSVVTFTVKFGNEVVKDAIITRDNGEVVKDGKFEAKEVGKYSFIAKKEGFVDSNVIAIEVVLGDIEIGVINFDNTIYKIAEFPALRYKGQVDVSGKDGVDYVMWYFEAYDTEDKMSSTIEFAVPKSFKDGEPEIKGDEVISIRANISTKDDEGIWMPSCMIDSDTIDIYIKVERISGSTFKGDFKAHGVCSVDGQERIFIINHSGEFDYLNDPI